MSSEVVWTGLGSRIGESVRDPPVLKIGLRARRQYYDCVQ